MKQKLLLLLTALMLLVTGNAWGETIGATGNGWNASGSYSNSYALTKNKTLRMNFTVNSTRGTYIADGWVTILSKTDVVNSDANQYLFMRTDCYGVNAWDWANKTTNNSGWFTCNLNNFYWPNNDPSTDADETTVGFQNYISGSTVDLTVKRLGTEIYVITDVTTNESAHYRHYFVMNSDTEDETIYAFLAADYANITINSSSVTDSEGNSLTGTLIGTLNHSKAGVKDQPYETFNLPANGTLSLHFKNYTNKVEKWNNWVVEITDDTHFVDLRGDGGGWQWASSWGEYTTWWNESNVVKTGYPATDYDYMNAIDGADVVVNVARSEGRFDISATIKPVSGSEFYESYSFTDDALASSAVKVNLLCEGAHLDLLPVSKDISAAGWATYCSPYALDLEHATGLTGAYIVTGGKNGVLKTTSVKGGTVPANTGLLLKGAEGTATIPIVGNSSTNVDDNKLVGVTSNTPLPAEEGYVLMASPKLGFYKNANAFTVGANTAYLPIDFDDNDDNNTPARSAFFGFEEDPTAINAIEATEAKAEGLKDGKFLENGKIIIVKNGVKYGANGQILK